MNVRRILYPTDFSKNEVVLGLATSLAAEHNAKLLIAHASEVFVPMDDMGPYPLPITETEKVERKQLESVMPTRSDVHFEHHLLLGSPIGSILTLAEDENVDLIVMGTHGRTGLTRLLLGSVAETIVRKASCPVLTVRQPALSDVSVPFHHADRTPKVPPSQAYMQFPNRMDMF